MIKDCQRFFEKIYEKTGDRILIDAHSPKDGTYVLVKIYDDKIEAEQEFEVYFDKKNRKLCYDPEDNEEFIKMYDYYSALISMNKPIDSKKKIHSNNFLSFAVKKSSIFDGGLTSEIIKKYYETLRNPKLKYGEKKKALKLYEEVENEIGTPDIEFIDRIETWINDNISRYGADKKEYLKIFFRFEDEEKTKNMYLKEYERYIFPNLYNNNDHNEQIKGITYGLPNDNMGMNPKKPFLDNKSRGGIKVPYLLPQQEAFMQKKFFDYLMNASKEGQKNIYFNVEKLEEETDNVLNIIERCRDEELPETAFSGYYMRVVEVKNRKDKEEAGIQDFQIITNFSPNLKKTFLYKKYLTKKDGYLKGDKEEITQAKELQVLINNVFFDGKLANNFFTPASELSLNNSALKRNLLEYRDLIWKWIRSGAKPDPKVGERLDKLAIRSIKGSLKDGNLGKVKDGNLGKVKDQFCLKQSIKFYFYADKERNEKMLNIGEKLLEKVSKEESWEIEDDEMYFYAVGKLAEYFLSQSKAEKKPLSKINPFLEAKDDDKIKELLMRDFKKYNYQIGQYYLKFKCLYASVSAYKPKGAILEDYILQGFLDESVIFSAQKEKNKKKGGN